MELIIAVSMLILNVFILILVKNRLEKKYKSEIVDLTEMNADATVREQAQQKVDYLANHDALTGLANRVSFNNFLKKALIQKQTENLAVFFLDLDRFQIINESMGHRIGDQLLVEVSNRLENCIGEQGILVRNGGDEFLIALLNKNVQEVSVLAEQIVDCFVRPIQIEQYEIYTTPSIGISFYPQNGKDVDSLVKKADAAMYQAKKNGTNRYEFYDSTEGKKAFEKFEIEMDLHKALKQQEFQLFYQPKLDLVTGKIIAVEALIRWQHPEKGQISPAEFIPLAEETGLIIPIGEWALRTACLQNKMWQDQGLPPIVISVNLSVRQLYQPNLVDMIDKVLTESGLAPEFLEIEITESMLIDTKQGLQVLRNLKDLGVQISLDDFGTGYSSLKYLRDYPINQVKIDQSFIRNCYFDGNDAAIVKAIIAMAHELKLEVVAEGVELKEHLVFLQRNLCNIGQGYFFSRPLPPKELQQKWDEIEKVTHESGISKEFSRQTWLKESLKIARQELLDTIRQQQGMIFKYVKVEGKFIHTLADGELMYRFGLLSEQIVGKELKDFAADMDIKTKTECYQRAWDGEDQVSYLGEINGISYIASLRPVIRGGQVVEVIGSCVDITERIKAEEALKLSEYKYRLIAENMLDLVSVWDVAGRLIYASPSHERILGFSQKEYEGKTTPHLIHPDDFERIEQSFLQMYSSKSPGYLQFRMKHANGDWVDVEAQGNPVIGESGEVEHFIFVGRDITEKNS
ncbi:EAL domain-containing protein [Bacillus sp. B15-48]|uniref:EAL domain-containing protein n=1 Tax=Bacillus sp. B15-48 TaxID=1548601 RepID=UPI00193FA169|nr:EAL domain-containing protein [Bacillus sp. B15-48]MBM4761402.1 EAL domain-containing protein [Bacillus sp. B15-48]